MAISMFYLLLSSCNKDDNFNIQDEALYFNWRLEEVHYEDGTIISEFDTLDNSSVGNKLSLLLRPNGRVGGVYGRMSVVGEFELKENNEIVITIFDGPEIIFESDWWLVFQAAISDTTFYEMNKAGNRLIFYYDNGDKQLIFRKI